jgi:hypothetical protein
MIGINSDKLFPIEMLNNLNLQMTTATILPIIYYAVGATSVTSPVYSSSYTLSEFSLNLKYIDIGEMASNMLLSTLQENRILYKSSTYSKH